MKMMLILLLLAAPAMAEPMLIDDFLPEVPFSYDSLVLSDYNVGGIRGW